MMKVFLHILYFRHRDKTPSKRNEDDESSTDIRPVISPTLYENLPNSYSLTNNGQISLANGHTSTFQESSEPTKTILSDDPWIRRCDQSLSTESISNQEQVQRQKSIQYETRLYYRSLSSTSDDCLSFQHRQPLLNPIDKDIEYVESRLRGQTTVSLPNAHSANCADDIHWRQASSRNYKNVLSSNKQQQTHQIHSKYSDVNPKQPINGTVGSIKSTIPSRNNQSIKTAKRRIDKIKDQKAAKTLR
jgi:hypothetical protein